LEGDVTYYREAGVAKVALHLRIHDEPVRCQHRDALDAAQRLGNCKCMLSIDLTQGNQKSVAGGQIDQDVSALSASSAEFANPFVPVPD
jgi:hypothetical protein